MISGIHISPSDIIIRKEATKNAVFSSLKSGEKVIATVLKTLPENKVQVLIDGKKVIIKSPFLLKEGEKLQVNLMPEEKKQNLKIIPSSESKVPEKIASLLKLASRADPFANLSKIENKELLENLKSISLKSDKPDKNFFHRLLNKSGILMEKKLSTFVTQLKGLPLQQEISNIVKSDIKANVLNQLQSSDINLGNLKILAEYAGNIENFQTLNAQSSDSGKYLIPFPVLESDSFSSGQLYVDLGGGEEEKKDQKSENRIINISFLLNMSQLGPLRADFSIYKKAISGTFNFSNIEVCDYFKTMLSELKSRLSKLEYLVQSIECKVVLKEKLTPISLVESFANDEKQILNIII